ncbi:hypothetical protein N7365_23450, partial [Pseudomonas sediminis]|uniref:hypothetical protein n=1 Tax=Pseudomonas sediminis TaxID=1691904 RepID=UPI002448C14D
ELFKVEYFFGPSGPIFLPAPHAQAFVARMKSGGFIRARLRSYCGYETERFIRLKALYPDYLLT